MKQVATHLCIASSIVLGCLVVAACKHNRSGLQTRRELAQIICN
ncbi:hypothetical protein [Allocoleopsis sp.]